MNTLADVLEEAADGVLARGLLQHDYGISNGPQCIMGHVETGIKKVCGQRWYTEEYIHFVMDARKAIAHQIGTEAVMNWSDTPGRTVGEVRDVLLLAAKDLRNDA